LLPRKPRIEVFGLGLGRTGTTSLAAMFSPAYRSAHEAQADRMRLLCAGVVHGEVELAVVQRELRRRRRTLRLEVDVAGFLSPVAPELRDEFPRARFILTIRDCFSWLRSFLELTYLYPARPDTPLDRWRDARFGPKVATWDERSIPLRSRGLYPIPAILSHWCTENERVLREISPERLLVVRTEELSRSLERIAEHCGIAPQSLHETHANAARSEAGLLAQVPTSYLVEAAEPCAELMERFWGPDWRSLAGRAGAAPH
jgi:hypothetical protein